MANPINDDRDLPDATPDRDYDTMAETAPGFAPADRPKVPSTLPPAGSCDCHLHMVGGRGDFPLWENRAEDPMPGRGFDDWMDLLRTHLSTLEINRGVIVHSVLYGNDNTVTMRALERLGSEFRGVGLVREDVTGESLDQLAAARIKGIRLNEVHDWPMTFETAQALAPKLADRDMHLEMLMPADRIAAHAEAIAALPCPVVFDHLGWPDLAEGPDAPGFQAVLRLVGDGHARIKLSALYRLTGAPYDLADPFVEPLVAAAPERCLWGSDWPHLLLDGADVPDAGVLLDSFFRVVTDPEARQQILVDAPKALYGFS